jgi:uncharacterized repeat protein (TIGR02543 family)
MNVKFLSPAVLGLLLTATLAGCGGGEGAEGGETGGTPDHTTGGVDSQPGSGGSTEVPTVPTPPVVVTYGLTTGVTGSGAISSSPAGVSCNAASCVNSFTSGSVFALTATPASGYKFDGWVGVCSGTTTCNVTMDAAKSVTAKFSAVPVKPVLSVTISGSGTVVSAGILDCLLSSCNASIDLGTNVTLTATAKAGSVFSGWGGACTGLTSTCTVTLDKAKSVTANFTASVASACAIPRGTASTPTFTSAHPRVFVNHGSTLSCLQQQLATKTAAATRFKNYVDAELASPGAKWQFQYWLSAMMFQVTGESKYADFAIAKVDAFVASEEAKIAAGSAATVAGDSYLEVGRLIGDVALVYDWCHSRLTAAQRTRWINYMNQSVANVWNYNGATWGGKSFPWSGWSIDNPSNNYYYSFLRATMLVGLATRGENAQAQGWIDKFRTDKIGNQLVTTFNRDLAGGGSREGTGYGNAMRGLFQLYDWWERSTGERIATLTPHTQASAFWMAHSIVPTLDRLVATGDHARDSTAALYEYHRDYMLQLMTLFPQDRMSSISKIILDNSTVTAMGNNNPWVDFVYAPPSLPAASVTDLSPTFWGAGTGQLMMRSAWGDKTAAYSNFVCGPFTESHAHRDQGSFQLFRGEWLAPTTNIYTSSGIQQSESMNNLVRVQQGGATIEQRVERQPCNMTALADNQYYTYGVAKVTPVYNGHAAIQKVEREYLFIKPSTFVVFDRVASVAGTSRIWTLNLPGAPVVSGDRLTYTGSTGNKLDVHRVAPTGLSYSVVAPTLESGDRLTNTNAKRVDVVDTAGTQSNFLHVMGTNASVTAATRSDASGQTGVAITLADGRTVTVRFSNAGTGGSLEIKSGSTAQVTGALPTTVTAPPLFRN